MEMTGAHGRVGHRPLGSIDEIGPNDPISTEHEQPPSLSSNDHAISWAADIPPEEVHHHIPQNGFNSTNWKTRRATPYFSEGIELGQVDDLQDGRGSSSGESSKSSTLKSVSGLMVSQKMMENMTYFDSSRGGSFSTDEKLKPVTISTTKEKKKAWPPPDKKRKRRRNITYPWYSPKRYSTRTLILFAAAVLTFLALVLGLSIGLVEKALANRPMETSTWKPSPGTTWNIELSSVISQPSLTVSVYDIDMYDTPQSTIETMHNLGRHVICYFSAGTFENWRPDVRSFPDEAKGNDVAGWDGERYLDIRNSKVREAMVARIKYAKNKGCDGIDPDNVDAYANNATGFPLTAADSISYLRFLASEAHKLQVAIGLKNAPQIAHEVLEDMDWAITESCAAYSECDYFTPYIEAGRAVLHIEYPDNRDRPINETYTLTDFLYNACTARGSHLFSTLLKKVELDEWFLDCPFGNGLYGWY